MAETPQRNQNIFEKMSNNPRLMRFSGNILVAVGVLGFMGGMAVKKPTVEKINMALGVPFVFAFGFGLQLLARLLTNIESLQTQIDELRREPSVDE